MKFIYALLILSFSLGSCMITKRKSNQLLQQAYERPKPYDAVIIPGYPYDGKEFNKVMKIRVNWAAYLYRNNLAKNFIFSGDAVHSEFYECKTFGAFAEAFGIPSDRIHFECQAEHSTENIYYGLKLAESLGLNEVALATDPFQAKMLKSFNKKYFGIDLLPIAIDTMEVVGLEDRSIEITPSLKKIDFVPLKEREGFSERLRGTFGKHIPDLVSLKKKEKANKKGKH